MKADTFKLVICLLVGSNPPKPFENSNICFLSLRKGNWCSQLLALLSTVQKHHLPAESHVILALSWILNVREERKREKAQKREAYIEHAEQNSLLEQILLFLVTQCQEGQSSGVRGLYSGRGAGLWHDPKLKTLCPVCISSLVGQRLWFWLIKMLTNFIREKKHFVYNH